MALGDLPIDRNAKPQQFDGEPLPKGRHDGYISDAKMMTASTGAECIKLEATFEGGRKAWTTLTLIKSSGEQNMPGVGLLSSLAMACGMDAIPMEESSFMGIPIVIKLDIEPAQNGYAAKNVMKAFYPPQSPGKQEITKKLQAASASTPPATTDDLEVNF